MAWPVTLLSFVVVGLVVRDCEGRFHSRVKFNKEERGYEDVVLVVDKELPRQECRTILKNIKVS